MRAKSAQACVQMVYVLTTTNLTTRRYAVIKWFAKVAPVSSLLNAMKLRRARNLNVYRAAASRGVAPIRLQTMAQLAVRVMFVIMVYVCNVLWQVIAPAPMLAISQRAQPWTLVPTQQLIVTAATNAQLQVAIPIQDASTRRQAIYATPAINVTSRAAISMKAAAPSRFRALHAVTA
jgi:hypothetical protein